MTNETNTKPITAAGRAANWWRGLEHNRAARARLRCADPADALADPAFHDLHRAIFTSGSRFPRDVSASVRIALVLTHVRSDVDQSLGKSLGPVLSQLRFRRLLQARDDEDIVREFRRAVDVAGGAVNVRDLASLLLKWTDENRGDGARAHLAFDFFGVVAAEA